MRSRWPGKSLRRMASPPKRVGLLAARSVVAFTGYLAALRLGATVMPLNPEHPAQRNQLIAELAAFDVLLADDPGTATVHGALHRPSRVSGSPSRYQG